MTRSFRGARRAAALLAAAAAATVVMSGCSAGQIAETAAKAPGVPGLNTELRTSDGGYYKVRNLLVTYPGVDGYPAGSDAPVSVAIFNDTDKPITVTISSDGARSVVLSRAGTTPTEPAESPEGAEHGEPARLRISARGFVTLGPSTRQLQLLGLHQTLKSGQSVSLTFDFDGQQLTAQAPVTVPLSPAPSAPPVA